MTAQTKGRRMGVGRVERLRLKAGSGSFATPGSGGLMAVKGVLFTPGVGVDVDGVAVLSKAVHQGDDAGGAGKDGAPLFEGEVGADDGGALFVAAADDLVEQVGGTGVAGQIAKLVQDQQVGLHVAAQATLESGQGLLLQ